MKTKSEERVMKKCCKCKVVKSLGEFHKAKNKKYGRQRYCRECRKEYDKQYLQDNIEKRREQWRQHRRDNKEKLKEDSKQYYQANKAKRNEYSKQYQQEHKEEVFEYQKEYRRNKRANDPVFDLRENITNQINNALKRND